MNLLLGINNDLMYMHMGLYDYGQYLPVEGYISNELFFILSLLMVESRAEKKVEKKILWTSIEVNDSKFGQGTLRISSVVLHGLLVLINSQGLQ